MRANQSCLRCGSRWRGCLVIAVASLVAAAAMPLNEAEAQSREYYNGATGGRGSPSPPPYQRPYGNQRQQSETDGLLEDALADLSRGRLREARRLLELVIEGFPNSPAADEARRLLAPIYAGGRGPGPGLPAPLPANPSTNPSWSNAVNGNAERADPVRPASAPLGQSRDATAERQWQTEVRRVRALDQEFRANVGDRVFFSEASVELGSRSRVVLAAQAGWLKRYPELTIAIEAHSDDQGSREFNDELARRRADAVRDRLIEEGVEPTRIRVNPMGREKPVAACSEAACAAQNRRAVTQLAEPEVRATTAPRAAIDGSRQN